MIFFGFCPYCAHILIWPGYFETHAMPIYFQYCPGCRQSIEKVDGEGYFFTMSYEKAMQIIKRAVYPYNRCPNQMNLN
jgi:hypothetical protein